MHIVNNCFLSKNLSISEPFLDIDYWKNSQVGWNIIVQYILFFSRMDLVFMYVSKYIF